MNNKELKDKIRVIISQDGWVDEYEVNVDQQTKDIMAEVNKHSIQTLWDLYEYMGQFPDALNLATMYERIKLLEQESEVVELGKDSFKRLAEYDGESK